MALSPDLELSMAATVYASLLEEVPCPLCGSREATVLRPPRYPESFSEDQLAEVYRASSDHSLVGQVLRCECCALAYISPRPRPDLILAGYSQAEDPQFIRQNALRVRTFTRNLLRLARRLGLKPGPDVRVLDVGCAGGAFPKAAADLGFSVVGVEPSAWLCEQGRRLYGLDLRPGVLADQDFAPESFDVVTLWDVIEHLADPREVLQDIHRLLRPGGHLILNYPDYRSIVGRLLGRKWPFWLDVHLLYFTRRTIGELAVQAGFEVVRFSPFWQTLQVGYVLQRAGAYFRVFGWLGKLVSLVGLGRLPITYNMGQTTLVARKP